MGVVFLAVAEGDAGFTKLRVVKRLRSELSLDQEAVSMFLAEARLAAKLHHPNVVQTNEVGFDGPDPFLEMEYLEEGQSLDAVRRRFTSSRRTLPVALSVWIVAQVLAGLNYAHELSDRDGRPLGIVHRDVSPHNVMLTYDGGVKLLDFGIAKVVDSSLETGSGVVKGKATYMAPEQAARGQVDRRADLFAVGVMLCEAVTGTRYWGDRNEFEIFLGLRERALPDVPSGPLEPGNIRELRNVIDRAMALAPVGSIGTEHVLLDPELGADGEGVVAPLVGSATPTDRPPRRRGDSSAWMPRASASSSSERSTHAEGIRARRARF